MERTYNIILEDGGFVMINGVRIQLNREQNELLLKALVRKSPFERVREGEKYFTIDICGRVVLITETGSGFDRAVYKNGNYCLDGGLLEQHALHRILSDRLWRFSMEHDGDRIDWQDGTKKKYYLYRDDEGFYGVSYRELIKQYGNIYFISQEVAEAALEKIVKPFVEENPAFDWWKM